MLRILIAEDHEVVRRGVRDLLAAHAGWEVVGEACTGRQALELARRTRPDILVVDLALPELSGIEVIQQSRSELPDTAACVFSFHEDEVTVADAIAAGARAYVTKSEPGARLVQAIESLARHEAFFSPRVSEIVMRALVGAHG